MVRRNNVFEVVRTSRNRRFLRFGNQDRPRGRFSSGNQKPFGDNNVRRVYKTRTFKGGVSSFGRRNFRRNANEKTTLVVTRGRNFRGSKFERNKRTSGRFNRRFDRKKQNANKNETKTQDEMDMELDNYMGQEATKARLDNDLATYFAQPTEAEKQQ